MRAGRTLLFSACSRNRGIRVIDAVKNIEGAGITQNHQKLNEFYYMSAPGLGLFFMIKTKSLTTLYVQKVFEGNLNS